MSSRLLAVGSWATADDPSGSADPPQPGVWTLALDDRTGELSVVEAAPAPGPVAWLAGRGRQLVAAIQLSPGVVAGYRIRGAGDLRLEWQVPSGGDGPCYLDFHPGGARIVVAHYADGLVTVLSPPSAGRVAAVTGTVRRRGGGPDRNRQLGSHPHLASYLAPDAALVVDLGTDELVTYACDSFGDLRGPQPESTLRRPAGSGPRHLAMLSSGRALVVDELSSTLEVLDLPSADVGGPALARDLRVAASGHGDRRVHNYPSVATVSASERLAYVANRGADTISTFDLTGPVPRQIGECSAGGQWPQALLLTPRFLVVAAQHSDVVTALPLGARDGLPGPVTAEASLPSPSCLLEIGNGLRS